MAYRVRRDKPNYVLGKDGKPKDERKYLGAPGSANRLHIPPGVTLAQLADVAIPIVVVEGEKKTLAMWRLANHETETRQFIPIGIAGVWNWRGVVGKTGGPSGERMDVKGPIADLSRIAWTGRTVFIISDTNVHTNDSVKWARQGIARELATRQARVQFVNLPPDCGMNGIGDLLAAWGPARVLELIGQATDAGRLYVVPSPQFETRSDGMYRVTQQGEQLRRTQLTNYSASITANVLLDDGIDIRREFEIDAELAGRRFKFMFPASEFSSMDWPIARMDDPNKLVIETCIATGARISEVLGLQWKRVNLEAGTIRIEQRVWHQDGGRPKSDCSRHLLGIGDLVERFRARAAAEGASADSWVFCQKRAPERPLWDSGVRDALHQAADDEGCDFAGLGLHSFRRANIPWRQQVGGSAIEASKIAGHSDLEMTGDYTFVTPERQNELTRRIQERLAAAASATAANSASVPSPILQTRAAEAPATTLVQQCFFLNPVHAFLRV